MNVKQYILISIGTLLLNLFTYSQSSKEIIAKNQFRYKNEYLVVSASEANRDSILITTSEFDTLGNEIKKIYFDEAGAIKWIDSTYYNENGDVLKKKTWNLKIKSLTSTEYKYMEKGKPVSEIHASEMSKQVSTTEYQIQYGKDGKMKKKFYKNDFIPFYLYQQFEFNEKGLMIAVVHFDSKGEESYSTIFEYDKQGNIINEYRENSNGKKLTKSNKYKGNLLIQSMAFFSSTSNLGNGAVYQMKSEVVSEYNYNSSGLVSSVISTNQNKSTQHLAYIYSRE